MYILHKKEVVYALFYACPPVVSRKKRWLITKFQFKNQCRMDCLTFHLDPLSSSQTQLLSAAMILMYSWSEISCHPNHLRRDLPTVEAVAYRIEAETQQMKFCYFSKSKTINRLIQHLQVKSKYDKNNFSIWKNVVNQPQYIWRQVFFWMQIYRQDLRRHLQVLMEYRPAKYSNFF